MKNTAPALYAACGAALSYYCLFPLFRRGFIGIGALLVLAFVPVAVLCLFRVLASYPLAGNEKQETPRLFRLLPLRITAFAAGIALGIGAGSKVAGKTSFGIPENSIQGISGTLLDDPRLVSGGRAMSALSLKMSMGTGGVRATAHGEITVFFPEESAGRLKEFGRGTEVFAEGKLRGAEGTGIGGSDGTYLFSADTLHITKAAPLPERFRTGLRLDLTERFTGFSADNAWGGLALALLLGIRDNLDTGFASLYRNAGCSFLLALSGMHLAVLIAIISFLLKKPLGLRPSAIAGVVIIIGYCILVGPLPSLNRAALMYLLGVLAVLGMLKREPLSLLCMAFVIQLVVTPQAGLTLSFILSYLALAGILVLGEAVNGIFRGKVPAFLLQPLAASLGAFIATAGVSAWFFGELRPAGIAAGLVLAPLVMLFMAAALAWLGLGFIIPPLSPLLEKPLSFMYLLMEKTAMLAGRIPAITANPMLIISLSLITSALLVWFNSRLRAAAQRLEPFD